MIPYSEKRICIDLILDTYNTSNPFEIIQKAKDDLDIKLTFSDVIDYITATEDFEMESIKIEKNFSNYE